MKNTSYVLIAGMLIIITLFTACNSQNKGSPSTQKPVSTTESKTETQSPQTQDEPTNKYSDIGIHFSSDAMKTTYNGHTYELSCVDDEKKNSYHTDVKFYKSLLYRYTDGSNPEEIYDFSHSGSPIRGVFIDNYLYYIQGANALTGNSMSLKRINLETLIVDNIENDNSSIDDVFQYDNYVFLICSDRIIQYDVLTDKKETIISSHDLDGYRSFSGSNTVACNDKLWIIQKFTNQPNCKVFCSDLNGSNLTYAGFSISDFSYITAISESMSEIKYLTSSKEEKTVSLKVN